jgi:hypothetical protein
VVFEVVSPSELSHKRQRDQKRSDLQAVDGVQEIVEIHQDERLAHAYRRQGGSWTFWSIAGRMRRSTCPAPALASRWRANDAPPFPRLLALRIP